MDNRNWPQQIETKITDSIRFRFSLALLLVLAFCFVLQVVSPLRLNTDAIVLLSMGESGAHGGGFLDDGRKTVFPPGYPALLALLLSLGLAHSWVIVGLNMVFLSIGLIAARSLLILEFFEDRAAVLMICSFSLLSYVTVKHSTIPLTDVPFFCCSMCCVAAMSRIATADSNWRFVILAGAAWFLAMAAISVRRAGVALVPPLAFAIIRSSQFGTLLKQLSLRTKLIVAASSLLMCIGTIYIVLRTSSLSDFGSVEKVKIYNLVLQILSYRLTELGELFGNVPLSKMPARLQIIVPWMGFFLFLLVLSGLATKRREISSTEIFLVCYMGILFGWPYYDARFWLPVIPLVGAYSVLAVKTLNFPRIAVTMYCIVFATLGFGAIAYSTRISFAGSKFPDKYGDGYLRPTYCAAFHSCRDGGDPNKVNAKALRLLREYE
jgi:hypothetical protein